MTLSDIEVRILGALIEKERTTPDNYPLSLNALTTACNQISNRDPVMSLAEDKVKWAVNSLRQQSLVRAIQPSDSRVMKFQHLAGEKLNLDTRALAVLCVLMLRGPQTLGELKTRTARLAEFTTLDDVEGTVRELIGRELVAELPRRPGQKEARFAQLLSGPPTNASTDDGRGLAPGADDGPESAMTAQESAASGVGSGAASGADERDERIAALESTVDVLRRELTELRQSFEEFRRQF